MTERKGFPLIELTTKQCHWPLDNGMFCGKPVAHKQYCAEHCGVSYQANQRPVRPYKIIERKRRYRM
jgi:hypothetical protein